MRNSVTVAKALANGAYKVKFLSFEDVEGTNATYLHFEIVEGEDIGKKVNVRVDDTDRISSKDGKTYNNYDITIQQLAKQKNIDGEVNVIELLEGITENSPCIIYVSDGKDNYKNYSFAEPRADRVANALEQLKA